MERRAVKVDWLDNDAPSCRMHTNSQEPEEAPLEFKHGRVPEVELVQRSHGIVRKDTKQWLVDGG